MSTEANVYFGKGSIHPKEIASDWYLDDIGIVSASVILLRQSNTKKVCLQFVSNVKSVRSLGIFLCISYNENSFLVENYSMDKIFPPILGKYYNDCIASGLLRIYSFPMAWW